MTWLRRWGGYLALVIVFAIACGLLSWWQWSRRAETVAVRVAATKPDASKRTPAAAVRSGAVVGAGAVVAWAAGRPGRLTSRGLPVASSTARATV